MDDILRSTMLTNASLERARDWLSGYRAHEWGEEFPVTVREALADVKREAVHCGDQTLAKAVWCLESTGHVQTHYLRALEQMRAGNFYAGWCALEQADVSLHFLDRHFRDHSGLFGLEFIRRQGKEFQSIYPYSLFISPEIWEKEVRCSICDARVSPRITCGHRTGEIYDGEMCHRRITQVEFLGIALVRNPVQKYSVAFAMDPGTSGGKPNAEAYPTVKYVLDRLASPWHGWEGEWVTERHPHERYTDIGPEEECPCVSPAGTYAECCLPTSGVLRPHLRVMFEVPPALETQQTVYY